MLSKIYRWLENIWNLRKIFDKYLPQIRELVETVKKLQQQISELKALKEELENSILLLKQSNAPELQDTVELKPFIGYEEKVTDEGFNSDKK